MTRSSTVTSQGVSNASEKSLQRPAATSSTGNLSTHWTDWPRPQLDI